VPPEIKAYLEALDQNTDERVQMFKGQVAAGLAVIMNTATPEQRVMLAQSLLRGTSYHAVPR